MKSIELIYSGLKLYSDGLKYYWIHEGPNTVLTKTEDGVLDITFQKSQKSHDIADKLGLESVGENLEVPSMPRPEKFKEIYITLNGFVLKKLTSDPHTVRIVFLGDHDSLVSQDYSHTTIAVSDEDKDNPEFWKHIFYKGGLRYIVPVLPKSKFTTWDASNFPYIVVRDRSVNLESTNKAVYLLKDKYDKYLIRSIDYQDQFFKEISKILDSYGIELTRYNREITLSRTSYISYRISQTPAQNHHPRIYDEEQGIISKVIPIDFEFRCGDARMFHDFKNRYNNVDLLTNFVEYKATDRYGGRWTSAVRWGRISEDFNHMYEMDANSNFSYQCQFTCELHFYEVLDKTSKFIDQVLLELEGTK